VQILDIAEGAQAGALAARENEVIDERAAERVGRNCETTGCADVGIARRGIAARVVMGEHDRNAAVKCGIGDDLPDRDCDSVRVPRMPGQVHASAICVEMRDPQALRGRILLGQASDEEIAGGRGSVELQREFGTLITHDDRLA